MVSAKSAKGPDNKEQGDEVSHGASILIVEDDIDQLEMFVSFALSAISRLLKDKETTEKQRKKLTPFNILTVSEMNSLEQAVTTNKNVIVAVVDCHIPDTTGAAAHDQFVKKDDRIITGQHKAVDIIAQHLPGTPITLISSMRRFQRTIIRHYQQRDDLRLEFISKDQGSKIKKNIRKHLSDYARRE